MTHEKPIPLTVAWRTRNPDTIRRIRQRFSLPGSMTVNRETQAHVLPADLPLLEECARRGLIELRRKPPG